MMSIKVLLFATFRDGTGGRKSIDVALPVGSTVKDLKRQISEDYPALIESMRSVLVAVNREYAMDETSLGEMAEVALFPPVSGG
jgi:molybdopterin converting factor subunit 1